MGVWHTFTILASILFFSLSKKLRNEINSPHVFYVPIRKNSRLKITALIFPDDRSFLHA